MTTRRTPRRPDVTSLELVGGPQPLHVGLEPHDPRWADVYAVHRERIALALAGLDVEIEHIGSTSVAGLAAKPIIDLVVAVPDITAEEDYLDALIVAGYELRVREPEHRLVRTPSRDVHVHVYERGHRAIADYLLLRDHLRADAADRALYQGVKEALMQRSWTDSNAYSDAKDDVVAEITERARSRSAGPRPAP
ncbi:MULTISPECIES: GrpB family protein [unclassified Frigoribacterium]|uniref:GrpB family protein n=1 Tax=unclassified Frigoribacterium TaxID=2627005 RepID=UPI00070028CA|nr:MULTISPECIES: GrpB family protein [unclassified Frigoribacterium]KQO80134.1 hypothetical protein ASF17_14255 [Frigoribacterium sp. Leaf263]KQR62030.1 hypothetical protein ASF89_14935 [Frigoribacterium sp. Leaf172]